MGISSATPQLLNSGQRIWFGTAPPSTASDAAATGPAAVGDIVINTAPAAGSPFGWQCIAAGTLSSAGTWSQISGSVEVSGNFPTNASLITTTIYATFGTNYNVDSVTETHAVAGTDGGAVTMQIYADASGGAAASGTALLATPLSLKTTANTPQQGTLIASPQLLATQRLDIVFTGTLTTLSGVFVKVLLSKIT